MGVPDPALITLVEAIVADDRAMTARLLVEVGADVGARNRRGAQPLHYAVDGVPGSPNWNPQAPAEIVDCLIEAGADPARRNKNGSTPMQLATRTTGRGGSRSPEAKAQQERIVRLLQENSAIR
jgi:ankyrin repeat protein